MSKRSNRGIPKKFFPGAKRITDESGKRVWVYLGKRFDTLREVLHFETSRMIARLEKKEPDAEKV